MSRVAIPITVIDPDGAAVSGASVEIRRRSDNALATIYQAETGSTTLANPVATNSSGRASGWLERGAYKATISGSGITTYTENIDAAPGADSGIDTPWLGPGVVTTPKLGTGTVLELLTTGTARKVAWGTVGNVDFGGTAQASKTIAHGLGVVPQFVIVTNGRGTDVGSDARMPWLASVVVGSTDSTNFVVKFRTANGGTIGAASLDPTAQWLAIG